MVAGEGLCGGVVGWGSHASWSATPLPIHRGRLRIVWCSPNEEISFDMSFPDPLTIDVLGSQDPLIRELLICRAC